MGRGHRACPAGVEQGSGCHDSHELYVLRLGGQGRDMDVRTTGPASLIIPGDPEGC